MPYSAPQNVTIDPPFDVYKDLGKSSSTYLSYGTYNIPENVKKSNKKWLARSAIAIALDMNSIHMLHALFAKRRGVFSVTAIPLGGNYVLLNFQSSETMDAFLSNGAPWLSTWFSDIKPYDAIFAQNKRLSWFKLYGVLLHAWSMDFFKWFGNKMGDFIALDPTASKKVNMEMARIQVLVDNFDNFNKIFAVEMGSYRYHISVVEESCDCSCVN